MKKLQLTPIIGRRTQAGQPVRLDEHPRGAAYALRQRGDGELAAEPLEKSGDSLNAACAGGSALALLCWTGGHRDPVWLLIPCTNQIALNGMTPPLPLARLEPGDLVAVADRFWIFVSIWTPEAVETPEELRDKKCPVCGGELGLARVVQCACGRWTHLEKPTEPDNEDALNCFLRAGTCGSCQQPTSLAAQVIPEIPEKLALSPLDEDAWDWESSESAQTAGSVGTKGEDDG